MIYKNTLGHVVCVSSYSKTASFSKWELYIVMECNGNGKKIFVMTVLKLKQGALNG